MELTPFSTSTLTPLIAPPAFRNGAVNDTLRLAGGLDADRSRPDLPMDEELKD